MENKKFQSLRIKFTWVAAIVALVMLVIQLLANIFIAPQVYYLQKERIINQAFRDLSEAAQISETRYLDTIKRYEDRESLRFKSKNVGTDFGYQTAYNWNFRSISEKVDVDSIRINYSEYEEHPEAYVFINRRGRKNIRLRGYIDTEESRYYVQILVSPKAFNSVMGIINQFAFVLFLIMLVVLAGSVYLYMRKLVDPLQVMSTATTRIANHDFDVNISLHDKKKEDEIDVLAHNIQKMSGQLEADMEELKLKNQKLEEELAHKNKMEKVRKEFVSNVSHELKTPIAVMSSYAQMLKYEKENIDVDYYCDIILEESETMRQKVEQLLELSYMEFGMGEMRKNEIDFKNLVEHQLEITSFLFEQKQLQVERSLENCTVFGNEVHLESAVNNYLTNAVKYTPKGGTVRIALHMFQNHALFRIYNESAPLSQEDQENIWESFYQTEKSHNKEENQGTGLGLSIVRKIVELHEGEYGVRNAEGGVEFYISIPEGRA